MSGVYIKGMEMPISCDKCIYSAWSNFYQIYVCNAVRKNEPVLFDGKQTKSTACVRSARADNCPLIPVPPHGRLIDADEISEHKYTAIPPHRKKYADGKPKSDEETIAFKLGWNYAIDAIVVNAPTIIPASDEDTNVLSKEEGKT